jgi:alpha-1,3-mannosyl-glycoprotein beta-1,2-N-acetylglucosaminyltransferase
MVRRRDGWFEWMPQDGLSLLYVSHFVFVSLYYNKGSHDPIKKVMKEYTIKFQSQGIPLIHMQHDQLSTRKPTLRKKLFSPVNSYRALALHYGWALSEVFRGLDPSLPIPDRVIILEEDIHTAPDFFSYMQATSRILDTDPTLLAVSAYNDNGHMAQNPHRILRSDFFPGLGWMMTRRLWNEELEAKWPNSYWDDWLREPAQRKNRHILRPEVSRTFHFGDKGGTSRNQFGSILSRVKLNKEAIDWSKQDLSYLHEEAFDEKYGERIANSTKVLTVKEAKAQLQSHDTRLEYVSLIHFQTLAKQLDIMDDEKASIPRTAYKGVVEIRLFGTHLLFLTPPEATLKKSFPSVVFE